ncbi:MAG TPA: hypothetical protein VMW72_06755 [Sedimentisphaerales bacterium]|nr:hypothetical protein [Sedimentisphaerales bacterium]
MTMFNLTEIEKKAYRSTFQDGLWDIFLGLILLILATSALLSNIGASEGLQMTVLVVLQAVALLAFIAGKKRITVPRMGFVKFGPKRKRKIRKSRIILLVSVLAGLVVFLIAALVIRSYPAGRPKLLLLLPAAWVANAVIVFSLLAYYLDCTRLYAYGMLFALPVPIDMVVKEFAGVNLSPVAFAIPATVMLVIGTVLLVRFLRDYPFPAKEVCNDAEN